MRKHLIKLCACALTVLLVFQLAAISAFAADNEWKVTAPSYINYKNILKIEIQLGDEDFLPLTVPAKFYDCINGVGSTLDVEYTLYEYSFESDEFDLPNGEFVPNAAGYYILYATVVVPPEYTLTTNTAAYGSSSLTFQFHIWVTAPDPDWHFEYNPLMNPFYVDADTSPEEWDLQNEVYCYIKDHSLSQENKVLGMLPIEWDLENADYDPDKNGEFEATVHGKIIIKGNISDDIDIDGVDGIEDDGTVPVEAYVIARRTEMPFGFVRPTKYSENPSVKYDGETYVRFEVNYIYESWGDDFSIWFTDDDGETFTDVKNSRDVDVTAVGHSHDGSANIIDFYNLEYNKWYGVCLELRGDYSYAGMTETIYFMFTEDDVNTEPSTGDRGGDGRWPFSPSGQGGNNGNNNNNGNVNADDGGDGGNNGNNGNGNNGGNAVVPPAAGNDPGDNGNNGGNGNNTPSTGNGTGSNDNSSGNGNGNSTGNQSGNSSLPSSSSSDSSSSGNSSSSTPSTPASFGSNTGAVSGQRLDALTTVYPQNVPFVDNGAQLQIPADFIKSLGLSGNGTFSVSITKIVNGSFSISVFANGKAAAYSGTKPVTLRIPYTPPNGSLSGNLIITDADGNIQPFSYFSNEGYIVLKSNQLGKFSIVEGKPATFSDIQNSYIDFLSARGIISQTADQKYIPYIAAKQNELYEMLAKLPGSAQPVAGQSYPQTRLTYSAAVSMLESYSKQIGITVDRKKLLTILSISEDSLLSRYGCAKLVAEYMKSL